MARKKIVPVIDNTLQVVELDMAGAFPFSTMVVYKTNTPIEQIIHEAAMEDENLIPLSNEINSDDNPSLSLVYKQNGTTVAYIFVDDQITIDTLVHECVHIVCRLFEVIGSEINESTEEFFAYLNSHMFRRIYKVITQTFALIPKMIYDEE